ncbi:hypothetical protein CAEBREN_07655 [Caenorhabditis brenneri]|uniref:Uncharacterized protein n=1 Tax=Caenorhabditis brenneri TaxID=135651 RepID=G0NQP1_CAEBE|nr:hypothetical protein CAEBREN_07655 [Caenorhabditis brenneri]
MYNNAQFFQENPGFQRHAAWNPYQQGPLQHPQHQDQYRWPIYQPQQPHQYQHQMYHQQVEQERHRQLQIQHHQQQQQLERERQLQAHQQEQHLHQQRHHQQQPQLHEQPQPDQHHLHQQHPQHNLPAQPQQEHNQFYPQPNPQPQSQEPSQPHQNQHRHQQEQHQQQQRQLQEDRELNNFHRAHQVVAPQQQQQGVRDQVAHQPRPQPDQNDDVEMLIEIDEDIEEIIWRAGPSNQANEDLPPQSKRCRTDGGVDANPVDYDAQAEIERLRETIRQNNAVIESQRKTIEEQRRKLEAFQGDRSIKVEVGEGTGNNAQQSSSPSLNAIGPSSSSPVLPASPPQIKRAVPRVKEEPRSPSPPVDQVGSYQEACNLWSSKYMDNFLADDGLNLDLKEYLFYPANSRTVPQEVKNVRPHCLYKSLHPDKGKSNHIQWSKLDRCVREMWQGIAEKIKSRQLRQEREGLVMRRNGRAVPSARNTFNPHQMPSWSFPDTRPVPHLYQNVFQN